MTIFTNLKNYFLLCVFHENTNIEDFKNQPWHKTRHLVVLCSSTEGRVDDVSSGSNSVTY